MAVYHLKASFGSRAGGQSARAKADYIEREGRYEKDGEELEHKEHGNMPEWAQAEPGKYWEAADENERAKDCSICSRHRKVLVDISSFVTSAVGIDACDSRNCRASDTRWYSPSCSLLANPPPVLSGCSVASRRWSALRIASGSVLVSRSNSVLSFSSERQLIGALAIGKALIGVLVSGCLDGPKAVKG